MVQSAPPPSSPSPPTSHQRLSSTPPSLRHPVGTTVTPGDRLGVVVNQQKFTLIPGSGTYIRQGQLYASCLGIVCATPLTPSSNNNDCDQNCGRAKNSCSSNNWMISVQQSRLPKHGSTATSSTTASTCARMSPYPKENMIILGRITRVILPTHAMVDIVAIVPDHPQNAQQGCKDGRSDSFLSHPFIIPLPEPFSGILRQQDVRLKSSLEMRIDECFLPGDVILARIHADGERDFILTTAEAHLGVIQAICESSGEFMQPVSWKEMQCPVTKIKEGRKVAKPRR